MEDKIYLKELFDVNCKLEELIEDAKNKDRDKSSTDFMAFIRTFLEKALVAMYCIETKQNRSSKIKHSVFDDAKKYFKKQPNIVWNMHQSVQLLGSHDCLNDDYGTRMVIHHIGGLVNCKKFLKEKYNIEVLKNLTYYPLDMDCTFKDYYSVIFQKLKDVRNIDFPKNTLGTYYIQKQKMIYIYPNIMYELVLSPTNDVNNKFDRFVIFSKTRVMENYAIKASIVYKYCDFPHTDVPVKIAFLEGYTIAIRKCEFKKLAKIIGMDYFKYDHAQYAYLTQYMKQYNFNLLSFTYLSNNQLNDLSARMGGLTIHNYLFEMIIKYKDYIENNLPGSNVLRYLLYKTRNEVLKKQMSKFPNSNIGNLFLRNGVLPFDKNPFTISLRKHIPKIKDVHSCIDYKGHDYELIHSIVSQYSRDLGKLYIPNTLINYQGNLNEDIENFNNSVKDFIPNAIIGTYKQYCYLKQSEIETKCIVNCLKNLAKEGLPNYKAMAMSYVNQDLSFNLGKEQKEALVTMFESSKVGLLYGAAGTGKSTLIKYILDSFGKSAKKVCIATTNPAVQNIKRKIDDESVDSYTINDFLKNYADISYNVIVIDECSNVSNNDMAKILNKASFDCLILAGDIYQLVSIDFGNWFGIAQYFLPNYSIHKLSKIYRTDDDVLLDLWSRVRENSSDIKRYLTASEISHKLDNKIFEKADDDEIVLCLNYDGLYGINNINTYLQEKNPNPEFVWDEYRFKVGDPILFNDINRFPDIIFNNLKGSIKAIKKEQNYIEFDVEIDRYLKASNFAFVNGVEFICNNKETSKTTIRFRVYKKGEHFYDEDVEQLDKLMPFQIAYAISIHKSQGLEYNSVKIIITNEVDELISHNIFYTAITRAKKKLKIFWTPEVEEKILQTITLSDYGADSNILQARNILVK